MIYSITENLSITQDNSVYKRGGNALNFLTSVQDKLINFKEIAADKHNINKINSATEEVYNKCVNKTFFKFCSNFSWTDAYKIKSLNTKIKENIRNILEFKDQETFLFKPIIDSSRECMQDIFGEIDNNIIMGVIKKLNSYETEGITFDESLIVNEFSGGICSITSLKFLINYFKIISNFQDTKECNENLKKTAHEFNKGSKELRSIQAAFNTIKVKDNFAGDVSKAKVESLLNYYGFKIKQYKNEISLEDTSISSIFEVQSAIRDYKNTDELHKLKIKRRHNFADQLNQVIDNLPAMKEMSKLEDGVYFLRTLKPANNNKKEKYGHSVVYIKKGDDHLYFDPNFGARSYQGNEGLKRIVKNLYLDEEDLNIQDDKGKSMYFNWGLSTLGIYKIE